MSIYSIGFDIGSAYVKVALVEDGQNIIWECTEQTCGVPLEKILSLLKSIPYKNVLFHAGFTGAGADCLKEIFQVGFINEVVALSTGISHVFPKARTVIEIGGESSKVLWFSEGNKLTDFVMNNICAAGTGSFLEEQANRLGLSIIEFSERALGVKEPPQIAGRCSVFAKTDMIHLQQEATPVPAIIAGLCFAVARNFKSSIIKSKSLVPPVAFVGGVASNQGVVHAFMETFNISSDDLIVPSHHLTVGAIGAALAALEKKTPLFSPQEISSVLENVHYNPSRTGTLEALSSQQVEVSSSPQSQSNVESDLSHHRSGVGSHCFSELFPISQGEDAGVPSYLGIDIGSVSTKAALVDKEGVVLRSCYLRTSGRPLDAVRDVLKRIFSDQEQNFVIRGVGTTGSGRYLIGDVIGADIVVNEITAQAQGALMYDPDVDTIFEIGGQDSKYILVREKTVIDFEMNKACAAGTGSFLEEQAERLGIPIEMFGDLALKSKAPLRLGDRCTVFMGSDIQYHVKTGALKEDIVAGLCYAVAQNYLNRVVCHKSIGKNILFQGAVAYNKGVLASFKALLSKHVAVPPNPHITGAIGVAILAKNKTRENLTRFRGIKTILDSKYNLDTINCKSCPNLCHVQTVHVEGLDPLYYGSRCDRYDSKKSMNKIKNKITNLFEARSKLLFESQESPATKGLIGFPQTLIFQEMFPFWKTFFGYLGYEILLSGPTTQKTIRTGLESAKTESCFPIKVAYGHLANLLESKVDWIFLPSVVTLPRPAAQKSHNCNCPYVQMSPFIMKASMDLENDKRILSPVLVFGMGEAPILRELKALCKKIGARAKDVRDAFHAADARWKAFREQKRHLGRNAIENADPDVPLIALISRPYNGCDPGLNLNLPQKLINLGAMPIPMDCLPLDDSSLSGNWEEMYWNYGREILKAARFIKHNDRLGAIFLTHFGCGPDSFVIQFFEHFLGSKPFLTIEIDEHTSDVGVITRCEAFLDSRSGIGYGAEILPKPAPRFSLDRKKTVFIPRMSDHAFVLSSVFQRFSVNAEVLPEPDEKGAEAAGSVISGKECYPCLVTLGDIMCKIREPGFDPGQSVFFMPATGGSCRFGQYRNLQRLALDRLGYADVQIYSPNQARDLVQEFGLIDREFFRLCWQGVVAMDILGHALRSVRPLEKEKGSAESCYSRYLDILMKGLKDRGNLKEILTQAGEDFALIPKIAQDHKPVVGIVGEIYICNNEFSNKHLIKQVEEAGAVVKLAPISEWLSHVNQTHRYLSWMSGDFSLWLRARLTGLFQDEDEKSLWKAFNKRFTGITMSRIKNLWRLSEPYIPPWFGEPALSTGKSIELIEQGVNAVILAFPLTCLPGNILSSILEKVSKEKRTPVLILSYDRKEDISHKDRLQGFMYQLKQRII